MQKKQIDSDKTGGNILLVDDDNFILNSYKRSLVLCGYNVTISTNAHDAISLLQEDQYDVVVSDIAMPTMDGLELLQRVHHYDPDIPVILITGGAKLETAIKAINLGAIKYLEKPVELDELQEIIAFALQKYNLAKAKREALAYLHQTSNTIHNQKQLKKVLILLWALYGWLINRLFIGMKNEFGDMRHLFVLQKKNFPLQVLYLMRLKNWINYPY